VWGAWVLCACVLVRGVVVKREINQQRWVSNGGLPLCKTDVIVLDSCGRGWYCVVVVISIVDWKFWWLESSSASN
jgi:hypothetical protein